MVFDCVRVPVCVIPCYGAFRVRVLACVMVLARVIVSAHVIVLTCGIVLAYVIILAHFIVLARGIVLACVIFA